MKKIIIPLFITLNILIGQSVPMLINYQAKLVDDSNNPITGTVSVTFRLYDAIDGGNELWKFDLALALTQKAQNRFHHPIFLSLQHHSQLP